MCNSIKERTAMLPFFLNSNALLRMQFEFCAMWLTSQMNYHGGGKPE